MFAQYVTKFPIVKPDRITEAKTTELVSQMLTSNTTHIEEEIDNIAYNCYHLTEMPIKKFAIHQTCKLNQPIFVSCHNINRIVTNHLFLIKAKIIEEYPAVMAHLLSYGKERLEQTGKKYIINGEEIKARKKTSNKWFETQDSISYWVLKRLPLFKTVLTVRFCFYGINQRFL